METLFRKATIDDFEMVLNLKRQIHDRYMMEEPEFYKDPRQIMDIEFFRNELDDGHVFVVESAVGKKVIGYAFISETRIRDNPLIRDQNILFISEICVDRDERRKGHGERLFTELENYGKAKGYTTLELSVWDFNEEAKKFYEKMNMRKTRIRMLKKLEV